MSEITIDNVGPIEHLTIPIPEDGGIVVLQGRNGQGKSHCLTAVQSLISEKGTASVMDGAEKAVVDGFGARMTVGKQTRRAGTLEVESLDSDVNLGGLVDPGIKDPDAADAARIRTIIALSKVKRSAKWLAFECGCDEAVVTRMPDGDELDLLEVAEKLRKQLNSDALREEKQLEDSKAGYDRKAAALATLPKMKTDRSAKEVMAELTTATQELANAKAAATAAKASAQKRDDAKLLYDKIAVTAIDPASLDEEIEATREAMLELDKEMTSLERQLASLRDAHSGMHQSCTLLVEKKETAIQRAARMGELKTLMDSADTLESSEKTAAERNRRVESVMLELEAARAADRRSDLETDLDGIKTEALGHEARAKTLRGQAGKIREVLGGVIGGLNPSLSVDADGRLRVATDRGAELFSDLSDGERWSQALTIGAHAVGEGGLLVIEQGGFEGIDDIARAELNALAKSRKVVVLTAEWRPIDGIGVETL